MGRGRPGGNPSAMAKPLYGDEPMAEKPLCVRLTKVEDEFVRSRSNRTEWLRQAIAAQIEKDVALTSKSEQLDKS